MILTGLAGISSCSDKHGNGDVPIYSFRLVHTYPHDRQAFTQGLAFHQGQLYEGTGIHGRSSLRQVDMKTGKVMKLHKLPDHLFGEGLAVFGDRIIQLTWRSNVGFIYDRRTFELIREFHYAGEGWGIASDGHRLIMSDGSDTLYFLDPETLAETGRIQVIDRGRMVYRLNELEYVNGEIYANIWQMDRIARIDPETGSVVGWIDLSGLLDRGGDNGKAGILNGIAYDQKHNRLLVTGKYWPYMFEIRPVLK